MEGSNWPEVNSYVKLSAPKTMLELVDTSRNVQSTFLKTSNKKTIDSVPWKKR